jgi:hypothetical protein
MVSRRRKIGIAVAFHGGGIPGVRKYLRRKYRFAFPTYWITAARTHPIRAFTFLTFIVWWKELGNGIHAAEATAPSVILGVSAWYFYRYKQTGLTVREAARQLRLQKRVQERWVKACKAGGISVSTGPTGVTIPPLKKLASHEGDVTARVHTGQYAIPSTDVVKNLVRIAETVGCHEVTLNTVASGVLDLRFCFADPLSKIVKPSDLKPLRNGSAPYGLSNRGEIMGLPVLNKDGETIFTPLLVGGVSGSGKSSGGVWAPLGGFIVADIPVRVRVIDPAGGVELSALGDAFDQGLRSDLFAVHAYENNAAEAGDLIADMKAAMNDRLADMKAKGVRLHKPTPDEPLDILLVDELLLLGDLLKKGVHSDLGQIMTVGRKAGFSVIACTQIGEKVQLGAIRELFPRRVCYRTNTREQTETILGSGGKADMAPAHRISDRTPGVGYSYDDTTGQMVKFRAAYFTDVQAQQIAQGEVPSGMEHFISAPPAEDVPRAVYWHYSYPDPETGGRKCWYIGSANDPGDRFKQHEKDRKSRRWWGKTDHSARRIEWYPTQAEGFAAEWAAIERDQPLYNDKGNRDNPARLTDEPAADEDVNA